MVYFELYKASNMYQPIEIAYYLEQMHKTIVVLESDY